MDFRALGQTFKFIGKPGLNRSGKEKALKYADVFLRCDVIHPNSGADPGIVHDLSRMLGQDAQQAWHLCNLFNLRDIANVALDDRLDIIFVPIMSAAQVPTTQRLWISTGQNRGHQIIADDGFSALGFILKCIAQKAAAAVLISLCASGSNLTTSIRPASESDTRGRVMRLAESVRRKRPGRWSASQEGGTVLRLMVPAENGDHFRQQREDGVGRQRFARAGFTDVAENLGTLEIEGYVLNSVWTLHAAR